MRPGTKGAEIYEDDIPEEVKHRRNQELLEVQNQICLEENMKFLGKTVSILVEGPSKWSVRKEQTGDLRQMTGRTHCDRIVVWDGNVRQAGQILPVHIDDVFAFTMFGTVETKEIVPELVQMRL